MSRKAGVSAGEARVVTDIVGELSQVDWATLNTYNNTRFEYDDQGVRLSGGPGAGGSPSSNERTAFVALVELPAGTNLPGTAVPPTTLRKAVIKIASTPNDDFDFSEVTAVYSTVTTLLAQRD